MAMLNPASAARESTAHRNTTMQFPAASGGNVSLDFIVQETPVVIRAFGLSGDLRVLVEMVEDDGCGGVVVEAFAPACGPVWIESQRNVSVIGLPGRYRLVLMDITGNPVTGQDARYAAVKVVTYAASINQEFLGAYIPSAHCS